MLDTKLTLIYNMKKIIIAIIITLIIMILIIAGLLYVVKNTPDIEHTPIIEPDDIKESTIQVVTDNMSFFTVQNIIQGYLNTINLNSSSYYGDDGEQLLTNNEIAVNIYNLLSEDYIYANSISKGNILNIIETVNTKLIFVPLKMNCLELKHINKYSVYGFCINEDNEYIKDLYFIVNVDTNNKTYSINPIKIEEGKTIEDIKLDTTEKSIQKENNNMLMTQNITDQYLSGQYFLIQKRIMLAKPEFSYNYLDEEYKNKRFGTIENYLKYISENRTHISKIALKGYDVKKNEGTTKYTCKDQYGNYYVFNTKEVLNYKVLLDIYTIEQEASITAYSGYTSKQKIAYNVNKWIQMVNNKDYQGAYDVLNTTFRNNNWASVNEFETFIKQNYPSYYDIVYTQYEESGENGIQTVILKDFNAIEQDKTLTIIMRIKDDMNYEMSIFQSSLS